MFFDKGKEKGKGLLKRVSDSPATQNRQRIRSPRMPRAVWQRAGSRGGGGVQQSQVLNLSPSQEFASERPIASLTIGWESKRFLLRWAPNGCCGKG